MAALAVPVVTGLALSGCTSTAVAPEARESPPDYSASWPAGAELALTFEDTAGPGSVVPDTSNRGSAATSITVSTRAGGRLVAAVGLDGVAVRFPGVRLDRPEASQAALLVRPVLAPGDPDPFAPADHDFVFGADILLDAASEGASDNGDNVVQRGLYVDDSQFKLQIDHRRPSCRFAGSEGAVVVRADTIAVPGDWYRLACSRTGTELALVMSRWSGGAWSETGRWTEQGDVGALDFAAAKGTEVAPVSVGAKADARGDIPRSSGDQFNGAIDNVYVDVMVPEAVRAGGRIEEDVR
ncbi:hypothetical protein [Nocardioides sp.]|uniref:hypothetical protein n=1 Tax=Nocardioides sp. TaxID=35761 RepID=UPI002B26D617|nr:hypothetical protein [Nocardioides sp.]